MQTAARERQGGDEPGRRLSCASFGVGVVVALALCPFACGQVTSDREDGAISASSGREAGIIDINVPPDAGRGGKGSGAASTTGAAGTTGAGTSGAAGSTGAASTSGAAGTTAAAGRSGAAGSTGAASTSGAAGTTAAPDLPAAPDPFPPRPASGGTLM